MTRTWHVLFYDVCNMIYYYLGKKADTWNFACTSHGIILCHMFDDDNISMIRTTQFLCQQILKLTNPI